MTIRKRRQPTPHFKMPPPFQPITGERAPLKIAGAYPYCAMMQIAAEDTHTNYVLCRGFDVRIPKFIDYDADDLENSPGIPVAKPFGKRRTNLYTVAHVFPAVLPLQIPVPSPADVDWRVGQNPGVAETCDQPCSLTEAINILYTDEGVAINWLLLDTEGGLVELCSQETAERGTPYSCLLGRWDSFLNRWCYDDAPTVTAIDWRYGMPLAEENWKGLYEKRPSDTYGVIYECVSLDCLEPPEGCNECEEE